MSRILHNRIRSSFKKSQWPIVDKRAVAFSIWTGRSVLLHKPIDPSHIHRRKYGMLVARAVRGVLKIRYLLLGGAVGGGMTLNKKYTEWKDGLPDMGWLNELLPDNEQWDRFTTTLIDAKERIGDQLQIDPRLREAGLARAAELRGWLSQRYEDAVAAAAANNAANIVLMNATDEPQKIVNNLQSRPAPSLARGPNEDTTAYEKRVHALQEEVLALQARYQRELQRLEQENRELRQQNMLLRQGRQPSTRKMKRSLIDMYSAVLDELSGWEAGDTDRLPRVVVVGDQSAGKTSVLEMIAQARIFPRGAGEMCTRAPVKVTLSEGPYHVAQFRDSAREFDLNKESDLADLRKEVELRMRNSVRGGRTVSTDVISMSVKGPGLHRMVLVDLPGVISTQTVDMAADTRDAIKQMTKNYMDNPNAIILCIQDGSVDAERSNVTDLVSSCDPGGKRTIFVLTKVDLAEENLANPNRIRRILEGKLFPMKALGYYAVVTGRSRKDDSIQSIREYEERFFRSSKLFKDGLVTPSQVTTRNLSLAVADCFWRMVRASVEQQADAFKAMRFNLETEWKNTFPRQRELDRDELFERARAELLDQSAELSAVAAPAWELRLQAALWAAAAERVFASIYLPAAANAQQDVDKFNTAVDIKLREWAESELPLASIRAGREALREEFSELMRRGHDSDPVYEPVKREAVDEALRRHQWEDRAQDVLRVLQLNALQDRSVSSRQEWDAAVTLMDAAIKERLDITHHELKELTGCDTSTGDILDEPPTKPKSQVDDVSEEWDCFEGGFPGGSVSGGAAGEWSPAAPAQPPALRTKLTDMTLTVRLHDLDHLTILCPQRSVSKLHVLHPSKNATRYYIAVDRTSKYNHKKIVVRSPLQLRNETSYALELFYKKTDLQAIGAELIGSLMNPFDDKMRLAVIAPQETYNIPLYIAYHCKLFLLPSNFESYQTATQGIWWMELANDVGTPRDMICPAKAEEDTRIFAMRILPVEGCPSPRAHRSIPNYVLRVLPPLAVYNRLPYAAELGCAGAALRVRVEAGERAHTYTLALTQPHRLTIHMHYLGLPWTGSFTLSPDTTEKSVTMSSECESEGGNRQVQVCVTVERNDCWELFLHAQHWLINKTGLPLQMKGGQSDTWYEVTDEPLLWSPSGRGARGGRGARVRFRAHHSAWSRAARLAAAAPGLVVCPHTERRTNYRLLLNVTLSELCPQLTKIVTLLPYFLVYNDTKRHLRFMEENEAADLWNDLAPQQCTPFWPQTDSMSMHCKYRDSTVVSQHFPITRNHFTVLRMDKGSAICVEVTGGTDRPFTITFKPYTQGDSPVRIDNLCDDLFLKLHQADSGQVALLSPYQSMLYTWDDPAKDRKLMWNIYNNKGKGFVADFAQDGYGEEKVSFHSVKHSTLVATSSVTSKLSSTLKRLTPKSPEPCSSSSDDSDSTDLPETHSKTKKMRKDKVIVYWISYMDGYQRVFALAQDERLAYQYRMRINAERSNYEIYMSLSGISLSVCVQTHTGVKELAYVSLTDSLPRWEVNVNHKWKQLSPDLTSWIEEKYQTEQKKCQLKEYIHLDLEKMQMTKPFFSELRRTYNPAVWLQLRKSDTFTYCHLKFQRLQIDNQLHEAVFPSVLYPAAIPADIRSSKGLNPCIEIVALKQYRPSLNQDIYKYVKVLLQEYCVNLDRGFVNYVFDILNHWKIQEKPAVRLRADLALVHMPLPIIAIKSQINAQKNVLFEFVHLSPVKLVLSLSSRGYSAESNTSPSRTRFGNKRENRPKLFNSDLLEYLFNSWGSSLCDMKDVVIRMSYLEFRNAPITASTLVEQASRHYWTQLVQQFYVLVLGLNILGNPYSHIGDFSKGLKQYYEPCLGSIGRKMSEMSSRLEAGAAVFLGLRASPAMRAATMFPDLPRPHTPRRKPGEVPQLSNDIPESVVESDSNNQTSIALALTALVARPTFDVCREAARASLSRQLNVSSAEAALKACVERSGGRLLARHRLPRHCTPLEGVRPYSQHAALGLQLLTLLGRGHYADTDAYIAHAHLGPASNCTLLVSTQHIFMVRASGTSGSWHIEWAVKLDDIIGSPIIRDDKLVLNIKQDELVNYFSTDEKVIEISDPEVLTWLQSKIECALILALEDKRCTTAE